MVGGLQHQDAGALAEDETVTVLVKRPGGPLRFIVALGQRRHGEPGYRQAVDRCLGAATGHHIGPAEPDHVRRLGDGFRT
jgi:hypothetical protein